MLSSLYSNGVVQMILLAVTIPLWWPVVRLIRREVNAAADIAETHVRWASGQSPSSAAAQGPESFATPGPRTWASSRRFEPAPSDPEVERRSIADKVMAASERGAHGFGRRPM